MLYIVSTGGAVSRGLYRQINTYNAVSRRFIVVVVVVGAGARRKPDVLAGDAVWRAECQALDRPSSAATGGHTLQLLVEG